MRGQHTFGTVRGRAGLLLTPTLLVFGTGGLAYGEADLSAAWFSPKLTPVLNAGGTAYGYQDMRTGWTGGGGVEWMFLPKWSAKVEYLYYDLGTATTTPLQAVYGAKGQFSNASYQGRFNGDVLPRRRELSLWLGCAVADDRGILSSVSGGARPSMTVRKSTARRFGADVSNEPRHAPDGLNMGRVKSIPDPWDRFPA